MMFMVSIIEKCLTFITCETFYKEILDVSQLVSMSLLCNMMNVLIDAVVKAYDDNREEANHTEVLPSLYVRVEEHIRCSNVLYRY